MPIGFDDPELRKLMEVTAEETKIIDEKMSHEGYDVFHSKEPIDQFFYSNISDASLKTMAISFDPLSSIAKVQLIKDSLGASKAMYKFEFPLSAEGYCGFCRQVLRIDPDKMYNDSKSEPYNGVPARIFAILRPYQDYPLVVISTAKEPPTEIDTLSDIDEAKLRKVLRGNFLIAGKSGAGKTYLLNYLLRKYYPKDARLGIIQEFNEIYPPNDYTDIICTPPRVPGQKWNDLEFLTEQTNLMRYDTVLVGEIKSSEAWPFVVNCASGTKGGATIHGTNPKSALQRLRTLCLLARDNINEDIVDKFIKDAIEYVVYVEDAKVKEIVKVGTVNKGNFSLEPLEVDVTDDEFLQKQHVERTQSGQRPQQQPQPKRKVFQKPSNMPLPDFRNKINR